MPRAQNALPHTTFGTQSNSEKLKKLSLFADGRSCYKERVPMPAPEQETETRIDAEKRSKGQRVP